MSLVAACSVLATRPVQEMSDTGAAIKAAREVQAETLSPELYRQANEWYNRAKREYKFKNFKVAEEAAEKARRFAEQAEFESLRGGGVRAEPTPETPAAPPPVPYAYPAPAGTPADSYDQRIKEEEAKKKTTPPNASFPTINPVPVPSP